MITLCVLTAVGTDMWAKETATQISDAGLLTERQAAAFVLREIVGMPRVTAANSMDISPNVLDKHLRAARDKIDAAEETLEELEQLEEEEQGTGER